MTINKNTENLRYLETYIKDIRYELTLDVS